MEKAFNLKVNAAGFAQLTFDLPNEKVNKFSEAVVLELKTIVADLKNRSDIKILCIVSSKENIFIAGADIAELDKITTAQEAAEKATAGQDLFNQIENLPFPTVAVINGACLGGGLELALACTYRLVTDNEKTSLGCPEVNLGIVPGWGGTQRLPRLVGLLNALPLILSGKPVKAAKALRIRLADAIAAKEFVKEKTDAFLEDCLTESGRKKIFKARQMMPLRQRILESNPAGRAIIFFKARQDLIKKTKGHYPAPLKALELIKKTAGRSFKRGLKREARTFAELSPTAISKNLIQLYYTSEEIKKDPGTTAEVSPREIESSGVVGAGVMGGGIAWLFSYRDIAVRLKDVNWEAIGKGFAAASGIYQQLKKRCKIKTARINLKMHHLSGTLDYGGFQNLDIVVEAVVENIEVKKELFGQIEARVGAETIICSNTSSLSINEMAAGLKHPERFVGLHFFNPVNRMPLVEVIPGKKTSPQAIATVVALAKKLKKTPILVQDCPGFLVNRILLPYMGEAINLLQQGAGLARIDKLIMEFGLPLGPFLLADEVGLDICFHVMRVLAKSYAPRMKTSRLLEALYIEDKLLGKKAKKGFYLHSAKKNRPNPLIAARVKAYQQKNSITPIVFSDQEIIERSIFIMVNEASRCLEEKIVAKPAYLDMALITGCGFPPFRGGLLRYADQVGISKIVNTLNNLADKHEAGFRPAKLLTDMAKARKTFY
ncbi:hypothetical protein A3H38_05405 [candidate division WOR-1 bacterium RIFCSPLOWO2_02_FULL_46_20]|uniref:enoyl-CoA hydratase n=1 Tax=candidate division WOR-1 bacterium RIFCSPLOWO2_02_FULL_46_20 TaxID=1802567 RepID=A0A1F4RBV3_UNCSA|nr:MAG: hypothetical protein A3H38_05405 [candidate division WOR-1 bacterium RIFCSPLOWO2_02_FULL_46_20]